MLIIEYFNAIPWGSFIDKVLIPFLVGTLSSALVVLLGVNSLKEFTKKRDLERESGKLKGFWSAGNNSYLIICGREPAASEHEMEPRLGYSEAFGIMLISDTLKRLFGQKARITIKLVDTEEKLNIENTDSNIVIFGSELSVSSFRDLSFASNVPYYQFNIDKGARSLQKKMNNSVIEELSTIADYDNKKLSFDYGTATRLAISSSNNLLILLNGNHCAGLMAAANLVTNKDLLENSSYIEEAASQMAVVGVKIENGELVLNDTHVDIVREWQEFSFDSSILAKSIKEA